MPFFLLDFNLCFSWIVAYNSYICEWKVSDDLVAGFQIETDLPSFLKESLVYVLSLLKICPESFVNAVEVNFQTVV